VLQKGEIKISPKYLKYEIKGHLSTHGRWVFNLNNYKTTMIDKSYIFNYELLLKLMPFEIPTPFV